MLNKTKTLGLTVALAVSLSFPASAQLISKAAKIGAYAGAMAYCRDEASPCVGLNSAIRNPLEQSRREFASKSRKLLIHDPKITR